MKTISKGTKKALKKTIAKKTAGTVGSVKAKKAFTKNFAKIKSRHPTHRVLRKNKLLLFDKKVVIRLGSTTASLPGTIELNSVESIKNCSDKLRMKELFEKAKLRSPKYATIADIKPGLLQYPIIKKIRFRSRGQGMVYIENEKELLDIISKSKGNNNVYFEEYFNGTREYRFHVSALGCFYTCRKMRKEGAEQRWFFNSSNSVWILEENPLYNKPTTFNEIVKECQKLSLL
jgi:glutathione synthase/RimK-type ligase-like ATP-grasp enzyme